MFLNPKLLYESGADYIKYQDGTMICWGTKAVPTNHNSNGSVSADFPQTFSSAPTVFLTLKTNNNIAARYVFINVSTSTTTATTILWRNIATGSTGQDYSPDANWLAIGQWK